eukprot:TRINITY_DN136_c0_g1_i15.p2 TRINITY_DN136_c0_g1~~TRINITY_DN136_c0_g1_i15.p2  ORF type:complete len:119 (+),score=19.00 TRINITY_DN136_c0_g1_i15:81-437(+)
MLRSLVGSEMCIRDRVSTQSTGRPLWNKWCWSRMTASTRTCLPSHRVGTDPRIQVEYQRLYDKYKHKAAHGAGSSAGGTTFKDLNPGSCPELVAGESQRPTEPSAETTAVWHHWPCTT